MNKTIVALATAIALAVLFGPTAARAEDGYDLWLRYPRLTGAAQTEVGREIAALVTTDGDPAIESAAKEVEHAFDRMVGSAPPRVHEVRSSGLILGLASSPLIKPLGLATAALGDEGYLIRSVSIAGHPCIVIAAN